MVKQPVVGTTEEIPKAAGVQRRGPDLNEEKA